VRRLKGVLKETCDNGWGVHPSEREHRRRSIASGRCSKDVANDTRRMHFATSVRKGTKLCRWLTPCRRWCVVPTEHRQPRIGARDCRLSQFRRLPRVQGRDYRAAPAVDTRFRALSNTGEFHRSRRGTHSDFRPRARQGARLRTDFRLYAARFRRDSRGRRVRACRANQATSLASTWWSTEG
jgi:hypothetical protein